MICWRKGADVILQKSDRTTIMNNVIPCCFQRYVNEGMLTKEPPTTKLTAACPYLYIIKTVFFVPAAILHMQKYLIGIWEKTNDHWGGVGEGGDFCSLKHFF